MKPYFHESSGITAKFMPYNVPINVGGRNTAVMIVKILMISFCLILRMFVTAVCR